jgi:hypothetical protein
MLDGQLSEYPPVDLLVARYLGYQSPKTATSKREAIKANKAALQAMGRLAGNKALPKPPEFIQNLPGMAELVAKVKSECQMN